MLRTVFRRQVSVRSIPRTNDIPTAVCGEYHVEMLQGAGTSTSQLTIPPTPPSLFPYGSDDKFVPVHNTTISTYSSDKRFPLRNTESTTVSYASNCSNTLQTSNSRGVERKQDSCASQEPSDLSKISSGSFFGSASQIDPMSGTTSPSAFPSNSLGSSCKSHSSSEPPILPTSAVISEKEAASSSSAAVPSSSQGIHSSSLSSTETPTNMSALAQADFPTPDFLKPSVLSTYLSSPPSQQQHYSFTPPPPPALQHNSTSPPQHNHHKSPPTLVSAGHHAKPPLQDASSSQRTKAELRFDADGATPPVKSLNRYDDAYYISITKGT